MLVRICRLGGVRRARNLRENQYRDKTDLERVHDQPYGLRSHFRMSSGPSGSHRVTRHIQGICDANHIRRQAPSGPTLLRLTLC